MKTILTIFIGLIMIFSPILFYIGYCELIQSYNCSTDASGAACIFSCFIFLIAGGLSIAGLNGEFKN